jgi:hypothetical protein
VGGALPRLFHPLYLNVSGMVGWLKMVFDSLK